MEPIESKINRTMHKGKYLYRYKLVFSSGRTIGSCYCHYSYLDALDAMMDALEPYINETD